MDFGRVPCALVLMEGFEWLGWFATSDQTRSPFEQHQNPLPSLFLTVIWSSHNNLQKRDLGQAVGCPGQREWSQALSQSPWPCGGSKTRKQQKITEWVSQWPPRCKAKGLLHPNWRRSFKRIEVRKWGGYIIPLWHIKWLSFIFNFWYHCITTSVIRGLG